MRFILFMAIFTFFGSVMTWITLSIFSAFTLGLYEISRKISLKSAAPFEVLFLSVLVSGLIMLPGIFFTTKVPPFVHGWIFLKSFIICFSWAGEFFALKKTPLSFAVAVRSCGPLLTILMALLFFKETPELSQWGGILLILSGYGFFAFLALRSNSQDKSENIQLRFILLMFFSTILGTVSGGIDRYLLKTAQTPPETLLIWFSVYSLSILIIPATVYYFVKKKTAVNNMQWSWIIPLISIFLLVSDRIYFGALHDTESTLAVTGSLRRGSIIISVIGGGLLLKERNIRGKLVAACFVFAGLVFLKLFGE